MKEWQLNEAEKHFKEKEYHPNQSNVGQSSITIYDKISGNVGIRFALEQFAQEGELKEEATSYLNAAKTK